MRRILLWVVLALLLTGAPVLLVLLWPVLAGPHPGGNTPSGSPATPTPAVGGVRQPPSSALVVMLDGAETAL
jgi:hypothetical protein